MLNITGFLEKFKKFSNDRALQSENIAKAIEKIVGVRLESKDFYIKDRILNIKCSPAMRQEIYMKKQSILAIIGVEKVVDIR